MGWEREVSILGFKKTQVFCIKNSSCVKTGKSLRAIATFLEFFWLSISAKVSVKTGKSLRAIATITFLNNPLANSSQTLVWKQVRAWGRLRLYWRCETSIFVNNMHVWRQVRAWGRLRLSLLLKCFWSRNFWVWKQVRAWGRLKPSLPLPLLLPQPMWRIKGFLS